MTMASSSVTPPATNDGVELVGLALAPGQHRSNPAAEGPPEPGRRRRSRTSTSAAGGDLEGEPAAALVPVPSGSTVGRAADHVVADAVLGIGADVRLERRVGAVERADVGLVLAAEPSADRRAGGSGAVRASGRASRGRAQRRAVLADLQPGSDGVRRVGVPQDHTLRNQSWGSRCSGAGRSPWLRAVIRMQMSSGSRLA